jgi:hypothetical protein
MVRLGPESLASGGLLGLVDSTLRRYIIAAPFHIFSVSISAVTNTFNYSPFSSSSALVAATFSSIYPLSFRI